MSFEFEKNEIKEKNFMSFWAVLIPIPFTPFILSTLIIFINTHNKKRKRRRFKKKVDMILRKRERNKRILLRDESIVENNIRTHLQSMNISPPIDPILHPIY